MTGADGALYHYLFESAQAVPQGGRTRTAEKRSGLHAPPHHRDHSLRPKPREAAPYPPSPSNSTVDR
jgi:hypothetical protein